MLSFLLEMDSPVIIGLVLLAIALILLFVAGYVKAPPDMAYIISGMKHKSKVVIGRASFQIGRAHV